MFGPRPAGFWSNLTPATDRRPYRHLHPGRRYRVVQAFTDYDGDVHPPGETWTFTGWGFMPYDDGLSLFVALQADAEWHIRMQCRPEEQGPIVDALADYLMELE